MGKRKEMTKQELMQYWVEYSYKKRDDWDDNPKKPLRTESWCDYLYDNYWNIMRLQGLTRNDIFYSMRYPMNRLKKQKLNKTI
jgi:hypothetical protein